ncbi:EAL domain-containing protein [Enterobacter cloacae]|uniref:EAL domain-containing protein n=1 Tax=Enterobacter cloacae TaxID=550 RepID=UPI00345CEA2A
MKKNSVYHFSRVLVFFLMIMGTGIFLCYLQLKTSLAEGTQSRLEQAMNSIDKILGHARLAAEHAERFLGEACSDDVLTEIRTIVATIPDVRTVSMAKQNKIYCTSVFGGRSFGLNQADYPDGSLILMAGNKITPDKPLIVYSIRDERGNTVLIGIDSYYISNILRVLGSEDNLYFSIGERYLHKNEVVTGKPEFKNPQHLSSRQFQYTVIAEHYNDALIQDFIQHERNLFISAVLVSLLLTFFFHSYLRYRSTIEFMLRTAVLKKQLKPYIQPLVRGDNGRVVGGEVLVRWEHPVLGFIPPDNFIPVAEQTGLIKDITAVCFAEVIRSFRENQDRLPEGLFICFNVSAVDFQDDSIVVLCRSFLQQLQKKNMQLVLEITEREAIEYTLQTAAVTEKLRQLGVQFSLDDFGTGNANFSYLQQFHPEYIKVDKTFTSGVSDSDSSAVVVKSMVNLAHKFNCQIIAEGVEDEHQFIILRETGIDIFQGYFFSRPVPLQEYLKTYCPVKLAVES